MAKEKLWINPMLTFFIINFFCNSIIYDVICINSYFHFVYKRFINCIFLNGSKFIIYVKLFITKLLINFPKLWYLKLLQQLHKTKYFLKFCVNVPTLCSNFEQQHYTHWVIFPKNHFIFSLSHLHGHEKVQYIFKI